MASKMGDFYVELDSTVNDKGIKIFENKLKGLLTLASSITLGIGFFNMVKNTAKETAEIGRMSKDLGTTVQQLDKYQKMFELMGMDAQNASNMISELHSTISDFRIGEYKEELGRILGLAPQDFTENFEQNINLIRNRLNLLYKDTEKQGMLNKVGLGQFIRLLRLSGDEYKNLANEAKEVSLITNEQVKSAIELDKSLTKLGFIFKGFKRDIMGATAPIFSDMIKELGKLFKDKDFQENMKTFFKLMGENMPLFISGITKGMGGIIYIFDKIEKVIDWMDKNDISPVGVAPSLYNNIKKTDFFKNINDRWENAKKRVENSKNPIYDKNNSNNVTINNYIDANNMNEEKLARKQAEQFNQVIESKKGAKIG